MRFRLATRLLLALLAPTAAASHDGTLVHLDVCTAQIAEPGTPCGEYVVAADVADAESDGNTWLFVKAGAHSAGAGAGPQPGSDGNSWYVAAGACAPGAGCKSAGPVTLLP